MSASPKPVLVEKPAEIEFSSWPRISPDTYKAYSRKAAIYWDKHFKRWVCLIRFDIMDGITKLATVPWFLNLGTDKEKPHAKARSNFFAAWIKANGGALPLRSDRMTAALFSHRWATVSVDYTKKNHLQETVAGYSVVTKIQSWDTGSNSQVVKQSTKPRDKGHTPQSVTKKQWQQGKEEKAPQAPNSASRDCHSDVTTHFSVSSDSRLKFLESQKRQLLERFNGLPEAGQSATQTK